MTFRKGQAVVCIDDCESNTLTKGRTYTVDSIGWDGTTIRLKDMPNVNYAKKRFEAAVVGNPYVESDPKSSPFNKGDLVTCGDGDTVYEVRHVDLCEKTVIARSKNSSSLYEFDLCKAVPHKPNKVAIVRFFQGFNPSKCYHFRLDKDSSLRPGDVVFAHEYQSFVSVQAIKDNPKCEEYKMATKYLIGSKMVLGPAI